MMIDFEDRMPAPPMSLGERVFLASVVLVVGSGWVSTGVFIYNSIVGWLG